MSRKFKIENDFYDEGIRMYEKRSIEIEPGITVLVGCNGSGKTTLIKQIKDELKNNKISYYSYDNVHDGGNRSRSKSSFYGDFDFLANCILSSEGEEIALNLGNAAKEIGNFVKKNNKSKELWLLFDAIDSGLSVDAICDVKEYLFKTIFDFNKDKEIYIIVSANEYEMARDEKCFDVISGRYISIKSYDKYRNTILKSRNKKDKIHNIK